MKPDLSQQTERLQRQIDHLAEAVDAICEALRIQNKWLSELEAIVRTEHQSEAATKIDDLISKLVH